MSSSYSPSLPCHLLVCLLLSSCFETQNGVTVRKDGIWIARICMYNEYATTWVSCLNLELFWVRLAFVCINWVSGHLMCIIQIWTTSTCSSNQSCLKNHMCVLGWISRSHARDGSEIQTSGRRGSAGKIEILGFLIPVIPKHAWKSWNLACCHDMAPTCCGNSFGWIGTSFGVSFLQTGASLKKAHGSERERVTSVCETRYVHCLLTP